MGELQALITHNYPAIICVFEIFPNLPYFVFNQWE